MSQITLTKSKVKLFQTIHQERVQEFTNRKRGEQGCSVLVVGSDDVSAPSNKVTPIPIDKIVKTVISVS